jgi:membrane fusion protein, multidrug efflux system
MSNAALKIAPAPAVREITHTEPVVQQVVPQSAPTPRKPILRRIIMGTVLLAALAVAANYGYNWLQVGRFQVSTDDAYVQSDMSQLGAKVAGYVAEIPAAENATVKAGDVIVKLDDGDYKLAVDAAAARLETQKATIATIAQQVEAQQSQIAAAVAQLDSAKAAEINAVLNQNRASQLAKSNVGSQQAADDATRQRATARANVSVAEAGIEAAKAQIGILNAKSAEAQSGLTELTIALAKAKRDLSFTEIRAPFDGIVGNRAVQIGQYVGPGTRLMALVPATASYIEANFKETQLANIHPGQKAIITVDAFSGEKFEGKVISLAPASGAEFSLLPPENATGNFTKITQRLPVKISVPLELAAKLRTGLSVAVSVDLRDDGTAK